METENKKHYIKITDLNVIYNKGKDNEVRSLENINLEIFPREYVIIFGPSGCGKSTLLYSIAGLQKPTSGQVEVDGQNIGAYSKKQMVSYHREKMGMIFQAFYLIPSLSIVDNICLPKVFEEADIKERGEVSMRLLERFNISDQAKKFPSSLSGGQKQRVSIARSLINDPEIILADEPVGNLDSKSSLNVMSILKELNEIDKKTIILVTHDPSHLQYGDRIVHMKDGKIIKIETVENKKAPVESFIFKDGKVKEELLKSGLIRNELIPSDLRLLKEAFKGLSLAQIGTLLIPFKVQQLFSHIFLTMTNEQIETAKKKLQDLLLSRIGYDKFEKELDENMNLGGAGWDRRIVLKFSESLRRILPAAAKISFAEPEKSSQELSEYLNSTFGLNLDEAKKIKLAQIVLDRLKNRIGVEALQKLLDIPERKGGLSLDRRTSFKVSREIEILLLLRYSA